MSGTHNDDLDATAPTTFLTEPRLYITASVLSGVPAMKVARHPFEARVAAVAAAGLRGLSLYVDDYVHLLDQGHTPAGLRSIADGYGVAVCEIEVLRRWDLEGEDAEPYLACERRMHEIAETFGSRRMAVVLQVDPGETPSLDRLAERFAALCDRAARYGLVVTIEPVKLSYLATPDMAVELLATAGRTNSGIILDTFHFFRSGLGVTDLDRVPASMIEAIHLSDADAEPWPSYLEEVSDRRRLPGEGALDLAGLLRALDVAGVEAEIGIEVKNLALRSQPPGEIARVVTHATRSYLADVAGVRTGF